MKRWLILSLITLCILVNPVSALTIDSVVMKFDDNGGAEVEILKS